jgi:type II secretory pathway pseudopilin PulG
MSDLYAGSFVVLIIFLIVALVTREIWTWWLKTTQIVQRLDRQLALQQEMVTLLRELNQHLQPSVPVSNVPTYGTTQPTFYPTQQAPYEYPQNVQTPQANQNPLVRRPTQGFPPSR